MRLLLDTHLLLWAVASSKGLPRNGATQLVVPRQLIAQTMGHTHYPLPHRQAQRALRQGL